MKKKFISLILAVTMFAPLISSFGISKLANAKDWPAPENVYTLGDTTETKYLNPNGTTSGYKLNNGNTLSWNLYVPSTGEYSFAVGFGWYKGTTISYSLTFAPLDTAKETINISNSLTTVYQWSATRKIHHISLSSGYYTFTFKQISGNVVDIAMPYEVVNTKDLYFVEYYCEGEFHSKIQKFGTLGELTEAGSQSELSSLGYIMSPITQKVITDDDDDTVVVNYENPKYPGIAIWSEKDSVVSTKIVNMNRVGSAMHWLLPFNVDLKKAIVSCTTNATLSVNGVDKNLSSSTPVEIDLSGNPTITYTCSPQGISNYPVYIMKSDNHLDALCLEINKSLSTITKDESSAGTGSISYIDAYNQTVTHIDSDNDPSTPEITEFLKRGSSSYTYHNGKYSYKFKLASKYPLVKNNKGKSIKEKNWCLIANNTQEFTGLGNLTGLDIYQNIGGSDALSYKFVNLYIGGVYHGVYELVQKATAETKSRVNVIEDSVLKTNHDIPIDETNVYWSTGTAWKTEWGTSYYFADNAYSLSEASRTGLCFERTADGFDCPGIVTTRGAAFNIKQPNYPTKQQSYNFAVFIQDFEDALYADNGFNSKGKHYSEYLDLDSMSLICLLELWVGNGDYMANSTYFGLDIDEDGNFTKITSGSMWDMSNTPTNNGYFDHPTYWTDLRIMLRKLLVKGDFMAKLYENNDMFMEEVNKELPILNQRVTEMSQAMEMNELLYNRDFETLSSNYITRYTNRIADWNQIMSDETNALRGVTIKSNGATLKANGIGVSNEDGYQWYKVDQDNNYEGEIIVGAEDENFTPTEKGTYYVVASGTPLAGTSYSSMVSNPITVKFSSDYDNLQEALEDAASGETLVIESNYNGGAASYSINEGATIDLNGHSITNMSSLNIIGQIVDSSTSKGIINADSYTFGNEQQYLPINDSVKGGYAFYDVSIEEQISGTNKLQFRMAKTSSDCNAALDLIGNNIANSKIKACVTVEWKEMVNEVKTDRQETICFEEEWMSYIIFGNGSPTKTYGRVFNFTIQNLSTLVTDGKVKMQCSFAVYNGDAVLFAVKGNKWKTSDGLVWEA